MARVGLWSCLALLVITLTGGAAWMSSLRLPDGVAAPGVSIAGVPVGAAAGAHADGAGDGAARVLAAGALEKRIDELSRRLEGVPVRVLLEDRSVVPELAAETVASLGIRV